MNNITSLATLQMKLELSESIVLVADKFPVGLTIKFRKYCTIKYPVLLLLFLTTGSPL